MSTYSALTAIPSPAGHVHSAQPEIATAAADRIDTLQYTDKYMYHTDLLLAAKLEMAAGCIHCHAIRGCT